MFKYSYHFSLVNVLVFRSSRQSFILSPLRSFATCISELILCYSMKYGSWARAESFLNNFNVLSCDFMCGQINALLLTAFCLEMEGKEGEKERHHRWVSEVNLYLKVNQILNWRPNFIYLPPLNEHKTVYHTHTHTYTHTCVFLWSRIFTFRNFVLTIPFQNS